MEWPLFLRFSSSSYFGGVVEPDFEGVEPVVEPAGVVVDPDEPVVDPEVPDLDPEEPVEEPEVLVVDPVELFDAVLEALEGDAVGVVPAGVVKIGT